LKKVAILGAVVVLLGCSTATVADDHKPSTAVKYEVSVPTKVVGSVFGTMHYNTMLEEQADIELQRRIEKAEKEKALISNQAALIYQVNELKKHIGSTWYVFSGSSPRGWDCSGLTKWFYSELGIDLPHSASKQGKVSGWHVDTPKIGDIVAFSHLNSNKYYHVGIYIGDNQIIHAGFKKGMKTEIIPLDSPAFSKSEISFVRVINN
jgi:cell wall-associated NlpC family hydrolase